MRYMTREEMMTMLQLGRELDDGSIDLPQEIVDLKAKIEAAERNAESFYVHFRVVDVSLVNEAVRLRVLKDELYASWISAETKKQMLH